jgi:hypothetical protein
LTQLDVRSAPEVPKVRGSERLQVSGEVVYRWGLLVAIVLVSGVAVWLVSPRFAIDTPSLVDDWQAISLSSDELFRIARFENPEEQRFRPGWILWNYAQWHTFDAPQGLVGPNVWNIARILVLVAGLSLMTALALPSPRGPWGTVLHAGLAGLPALLVVAVPKFARDLARFGPQEPLLLGGMALGGSLLVLAGQSLLDDSRADRRFRTALLGIAGSGLWILGVYQKETSLAVVPLIAAVLFAGRGRLSSWARLSRGRKFLLGVLCAAVVLPLVHVAIESARIAARGDLVYGAEVDGGRGIVRGFIDLYDWAHEPLPPAARLIVVGAFVVTALATVARRRLDVVALGALVSGLLTLALAGQAGFLATRYYIPAFALFAVALALSLARLRPSLQLLGLLCIVFAFTPPPDTRAEVGRWTDEEEQQGALVRAIAGVENAGCVVAMAGLDVEATEALPVLVGVEQNRAGESCADDTSYFVVGPHEQGAALGMACAPGALERIVEVPELAILERCERLRAGPVRDPELGLVEPQALVAMRRLRSGS